jgi:hypothetical protein
MTLTDRRTAMVESLQKLDAAREKYRTAQQQLTSQMDQLTGAIRMLDQLIAEEGNSHAVSEQIATTPDGDEVRAGEAGEENGARYDEVPAPGLRRD